jgi:hypothetical protein
MYLLWNFPFDGVSKKNIVIKIFILLMTISKNLSIAYGMIIDSNTQLGLTDADKKEKQNWIKFEENF